VRPNQNKIMPAGGIFYFDIRHGLYKLFYCVRAAKNVDNLHFCDTLASSKQL